MTCLSTNPHNPLATAAQLSTAALAREMAWCLGQARASVVRSMEDWVEAEIVLPNGPFAGERYRHARHPASRPWFRALDSGRWSRHAATGPTQNGKTLMCFIAPLLYHLFEIGETAICGLPNMDMANDKWTADLLPVIEASEYRDLLPRRGEGSQGGQVKRSIAFRNGASLRFMSGGGGDKQRAGYTARVLAITEVDGMDTSGAASREADKVEQLEGRTLAFGRTGKRVYLECTTSIARGRIHQELTQGTDSRLARRCPHCRAFVTPEREHLAGWESALSEDEAAAAAFWSCPACGEAWSEDERKAAAQTVLLVHRGQSLDKRGRISGEPPATQTLGYRWSAIDNPFVTAADLGAEEWRARRAADRDNAEKKLRQFIWAVPYDPPEVALTPLEAADVEKRTAQLKRGVLPEGCQGIAVQVDTGKRELNWVALALANDGETAYCIEYGEHSVESDRLGVRRALVEAGKSLAAYLENGWQGRKPDTVWFDSGYHEHTNPIYELCATLNAGCEPGRERYRPSKGYGEGQRYAGPYIAPAGRTKDVLYVGREFYMARVRRNGRLVEGVVVVHVNADYYKSEVHQRLTIPAGEAGALVLYATSDPLGHADFAQQITAERQIEKMFPIRGPVVVWERVRRANHKLDATYGALAGLGFIHDERLRQAQQAAQKPGDWFERQKNEPDAGGWG